MTEQDAWRRLGERLVQRRVELGYRDREAFARERGLSHSRTLSDLENAKRDNYSPATRADVERLYRWEYGSVQRVLDGGEPTPLGEQPSTLAEVSELELLSELLRRAVERERPSLSREDVALAADRRPAEPRPPAGREARVKGRRDRS